MMIKIQNIVNYFKIKKENLQKIKQKKKNKNKIVYKK